MRPLTRFVAVAAASAATFGLVAAHNADPTFAEDVAPIFYKNCTVCHHTGGNAPFSLVDLDSAQLDNMQEAVSTGRMPPWGADGPKGVFKNDRRISDAERQLIVRWLETGAKAGDLKKLPAKPVYPSAWEMGEPDLVVSMPEDYTVPASGTIEYQYFQVPVTTAEEKWIRSVEIKPGAREVVHHVLVYARVPAPPPSATPAPAPAAPAPGAAPAPRPTQVFVRNPQHGLPPDPPRVDSAHPKPRNMGALIGSTAPGTNVITYPEGTAMRLRPGTIITFEVHYTAHGHAMKDRTAIGFRLTDKPTEEIYASSFQNGSFTIPAGAKDYAVPSDLTAGQAVKIWGMLPHTHLRGRRWKYTLDRTDGTSQVVLDVPRYDFNWQTYYLYNTPLQLNPGDKINAMAWYDNSPSKTNPNAKVDVKWGDQTWEEMQYTGFLYSVVGRKVQ